MGGIYDKSIEYSKEIEQIASEIGSVSIYQIEGIVYNKP